jgi:hypothetical protein
MRYIALVALCFSTLAGCRTDSSRDDAKPTASPVGRGAEAKPSTPSLARFLTPAPHLALGTPLPLVLETTAASDKSQPGDNVLAKLAVDLKEGDRVVVPAGAELRGEVLAAIGSGRVKGRARLAVGFMKLVVGGKTYGIQTSSIDVTAASDKGRDAKIVGGGAAAGALIGAIAGGGSGAAKGAAIGGVAGGGTVLATKGKEVVFAAGSKHTVTLKASLTLD